MKKIFTLLIGIVFSIAILKAQDAPPQAFSYKATITKTTPGGNVVAVVNKTVGLKIVILQGNSGTNVAYSETFKPTTNTSGQIDIVIGLNPDPPYSFSNIKWAENIFSLQVWVDINGGTAYGTTAMSTTQLLSVPYALYSDKTGFALSADYNSLTNKPTFFDGTWTSLSGKPTTVSGFGITDAVTTTGDQIIGGNKTFTGSTTVLPPINGTDAATKDYVDALLAKIDNLEAAVVFKTKIADVDGNYYKVVTIGSQVWMAENLRTTKNKYGVSLNLVKRTPDWVTTFHDHEPAVCWYNFDVENKSDYGGLYNAWSITFEICPEGWRIPDLTDWRKLLSYLDDPHSLSIKLKETGELHWVHNPESTNETGFTALPGGFIDLHGIFYELGQTGFWWSRGGGLEDEILEIRKDEVNLRGYNPDMHPGVGYSIRCIKE